MIVGIFGSQRACLRRYGTTRRVTADEILYSPADDSCDLLVVLSGEVVVSNDALGRSVELARHWPGQFAGELNMLTGQRPFLTARADPPPAIRPGASRATLIPGRL